MLALKSLSRQHRLAFALAAGMRHAPSLPQRACFSTSRRRSEGEAPSRRVPRATLYTGTDCQLCDVAKAVLDDVAREAPLELTLYNIRDDTLPDVHRWRRAYQYDIPVLHIEGSEVARHRLDRAALLQQLRAAQQALDEAPKQ